MSEGVTTTKVPDLGFIGDFEDSGLPFVNLIQLRRLPVPVKVERVSAPPTADAAWAVTTTLAPAASQPHPPATLSSR